MSDSIQPVGEPRVGRSVSIDAAAQLLGVSRRTVYNRIREGRLLTIRTLGGSQRVLIESLANAASAFGVRPLVSEFGGRQ
jgi:excisionase family DNA binding protein